MTGRTRRRFSRTFKLDIIERMSSGENVSALSREFGIKREILYRWRDAYRRGGEVALRSKPGPLTKAEAAELSLAQGAMVEVNNLAAARAKIAELERKIGQQQLDVDFFREALRRIEGSRQPSDEPGVTASSRASKR